MFSDDAPLVPAVFRERTSAEAAIDALKLSGIDAGDIGVAVPLRRLFLAGASSGWTISRSS